MENAVKTRSVPSGWQDTLDRSIAQANAGEVIPLAVVLEELQTAADEIDAQPRSTSTPPAR